MQKEWWKSKTFWSATLFVVISLAEMFGYTGITADVLQTVSIGGMVFGVRDALP